jgi:heptosyltransferase-2
LSVLSHHPKKILIVAPNWVGDLVMSQSLYQLIKTRTPNAELHLLAPDWCLDVASRMPEIDKTISLPGEHGKLQLLMRYRFAKDLKKEGYTDAYVLPNSLKSSLIPWLANIPKRIGFKGEMRYGFINDLRPLNKRLLPLMVQRFAALAFEKEEPWQPKDFPAPSLEANTQALTPLLERFALTLSKPILALAPGAAFGGSKCWPLENYAALANHYLDKGSEVWLFASPKEAAAIETINRLCATRCKVLTEPRLGEKVDLLSQALCLVSNDSGLMHIGAALKVPTIGIYGSTSPAFTPPLGEKSRVIEQQHLACRPCFKRQCPKSGDLHLKCLKDITPNTLIHAVEEFIQ